MEEKIINAYPYEIDADDVDSMAEITPCDDVTSAETEAAPEAETETETAYESSTESEAAETAEAAAEEEEPEAAEEPQGSAPGTDAEETDAITDREEADRKYVSETVTRIYSELKDIHKLYHNEFAGRLRSMQDKLDYYKKLEEGRVYDGILGELARIYVINEDLNRRRSTRSSAGISGICLWILRTCSAYMEWKQSDRKPVTEEIRSIVRSVTGSKQQIRDFTIRLQSRIEQDSVSGTVM